VTPDPDPLEPLLDAAGRSVQPTDPRWDQVADRLARTPQQRRRRLWWLAPPLAAAAAAGLLLALWLIPSPHADAKPLPIEVKRLDVDLTVLSASDFDMATLYMPLLGRLRVPLSTLSMPVPGGPDEDQRKRVINQVRFILGQAPTGQALVKDHRLILNLRKGENVVRFDDVAATIDPTSVHFASDTDPKGTQVVEQNFEFDLVNADALLKRHVEKEVTCVGRDGSETTGHLASFDDQNIVLTAQRPGAGSEKPQTQAVARATLRAVRFDEVPADLLVKPTLVWKLNVATPGKHDTTVSYLCGLVKWRADYVAVVTPGDGEKPERIDLTGWVTLDNGSGTTFEKAGLKLIAGDVNRVRDPWMPQPVEEVFAPAPPAGPGGGGGGKMLVPKEFTEKSFFEYHLYTLTVPSTVRDREVKQLNLLRRSGIRADRRYVFDPSHGVSRNLAVELVAKNEKENNLGVPLPKGRVAFEQADADGETALTGRAEIDHTPVKEELSLRHGYAFDVVGEFKHVDPTHFEMRVRNHRLGQPINVRAVADVRLGQKVKQASRPFVMHDVTTAHFDFPLRANAEEVIRYEIEGKAEEGMAIP
jgi:hypothetical protein